MFVYCISAAIRLIVALVASEVTTLWCYTNVFIIIFLAHWYFIPRGVKTKQIGEISGMVTLITRKLIGYYYYYYY